MSEVLGVIQIPWDPAKWNPNRMMGRCGQHASRIKKQGEGLALLFWRQDRLQVDFRIRVDFTIRRARRLDPDNADLGLKPIRDGLFRRNWNHGEGVVPDDDEGWLEYGPIVQHIDAFWKGQEEILVTISRAEDQGPLAHAPPFKLRKERGAPKGGWVPFRGDERRGPPGF